MSETVHCRVSPQDHHNVTRCGIVDTDGTVASNHRDFNAITCKTCRKQIKGDHGQFKYDGRGAK